MESPPFIDVSPTKNHHLQKIINCNFWAPVGKSLYITLYQYDSLIQSHIPKKEFPQITSKSSNIKMTFKPTHVSLILITHIPYDDWSILVLTPS